MDDYSTTPSNRRDLARPAPSPSAATSPVVRLGYGTMQLPGEGVWGPPKDHDEAIRVLRRAVELGITFFDTADSYGPNVAEELLAEALHPYADDLVIATKAGLTRQGPGQWTPVGNPAYLRQQASSRCAGSAWSGSTSSSCTASTATYRPRTRSAS